MWEFGLIHFMTLSCWQHVNCLCFLVTLTTFVNVQGQSSTQIKEEEDEDTNKQPAAKRKRGQSKSQTKREEMPKEEMKSEGNFGFVVHLFCQACSQCEMG